MKCATTDREPQGFCLAHIGVIKALDEVGILLVKFHW